VKISNSGTRLTETEIYEKMGLRGRKEFGMKKVFIGGSTRFLEFEQGRLRAVG